MESGQLILPREHPLKLSANRAPFLFDQARPGKYRVVVNRRVADRAEGKIEPFRPSNDPHEAARNNRGASHRLDAGGATFLHRVLLMVSLWACDASQRASPAALFNISNRLRGTEIP
jgi:hypothetical protein